MSTPSTVPPPPARPRPPFTVAAHRAYNDALEASQRAAERRDPELALRRARAELDSVLSMLASKKTRGAR